MHIPDILDFALLSHSEIKDLLARYSINLTVAEVLKIQQELLGRPPTLAECILWSIQGSEHCSYKSSRPHLQQFVTDAPHVILGPKEDAGIVTLATDHAGLRYGLVVSHESHNHPSQIVPYEGAATGVGGNVRDVCCMGAEVIAIADSLRFGDIDHAKTQWIHHGVVAGIGGYGNPLGVPTLAGDTYYNAAYNENCLVTVVTLGIVKEADVIHSYAPKNAADHVFILVGKPTDNSGFGGASFASATLDVDQSEQNQGAVQEPNAFLQRHLLKANYHLFDILKAKNLLNSVGFKDLGAGGIACASVELAEAGGYGADINIDQVITSMPDLAPAVLLCAETQERFMWVVPPDLVPLILDHYNKAYALPDVSYLAGAQVIGKIRTDGQFKVTHHGITIIDAKASDITQGIQYNRPYQYTAPLNVEPTLPPTTDFNQLLLSLLAHENIASRAPIIETYDKQVQGRTIIEAGCADAGVMAPFNDDRFPIEIQQVGVALSLDHNPRYNQINAYWGAVNAVCESIRNVVAVGAAPIALTDCLCFGNPEDPAQMGEFVEAVRGIKDASAAMTLRDYPSHTLPIIAGNVSLYNNGIDSVIPPSPMIACVGQLPDVSRALTYDFKRTNSILILIGPRADECGGSVYYQLHQVLGQQVPKPDLKQFAHEMHAVYSAIQAGFILSAHDIADGGIAVALAEMSFKNQIGCRVKIHADDLSNEKILCSETPGFILEVGREKFKEVTAHFALRKIYIISIGETIAAPVLQMNDVIELNVVDAKAAWENGLRRRII